MKSAIPPINISVIADCPKTELIETFLKKREDLKIEKYADLKEFSARFDSVHTDIVLIGSDRLGGIDIKDVKSFFREEFDIPSVIVVNSENDPVLEEIIASSSIPYILPSSSPREVQLVIELALEKFRSEKEKKQGELQYKMFLENSSDLFSIIDLQGIIKYESPSIKKLLGIDPDELIGKLFLYLVHPEDKEQTAKIFFENMAKEKSSFLTKFRYIGKNGTSKIIEAQFNNFLHVEGINAIIMTGKDITEKRTIEKKFLTNLRRYNALIENLPIGIYRSTPKGDLLMANSYLIKMLGYSSYAELEKIDLNSCYVQQSIREIFKELISKYGEAKGFEFEIRKKNGDIIYVRDSSRAIYDEKGAVSYYEGVIEDITDKKKFESELITAKGKAEKADKLKSYFMAHLSHEIRTPVNSILTFVSLLKEEFEEKLTDELKDSFTIIGSSADRLIRTIDLIMNISSLQTGNFDTSYEWLDIERDILGDVLRDYELKARYKGLKLLFKNRANKMKIFADRYSAQQLFCNLIDNAVKYTPKNGEIAISIHASDNNLHVDVADTGIGISSEYLPNLFTPFTQEEMGYTRKFDGNGLGLAIAKKYADLNNAMIDVKSVKGKGSNFTVVFKDAVKIPTENFS